MFRSLITMSILALAVAFLVHMLVYGLLANQTRVAAYAQLQQSRHMAQIITRLSRPDNASAILTALASGEPGRLEEYATWSDAPPEALTAARQTAQEIIAFETYLDVLPPASRAAVMGDLSAVELLDRLGDAQTFGRFVQTINNLSLAPPLAGFEDVQALVTERRPILLEIIAATRQGHRRAIGMVNEAYGGQRPRALAADPPADFLATLQKAGFRIESQTIPKLEVFAQRANDLATLARLITVPEVRQAVARELDQLPTDVSLEQTLLYVGPSSRRARWLSRVLLEGGAADRFDADRVADLAQHYSREQRLQAAVGAQIPSDRGGILGLPTRTKWLIVLSFLVCVVGVANAMLMSVTERFTEIATMKCLGAMDAFVMAMFVVEATIQGIVGGVIGIVVGVVLALARGGIEFGSLLGAATSALPDVVLAVVLSLVVGMLLATVAAVGPSFVAARLAPMEAMRVE